MNGIEILEAERVRQVAEKGYTLLNDSGRSGDLARAAACYLDWAASQLEGVSIDEPHAFWPWSNEDWKPVDVKTALTKAGALAAAALDALEE